MLEPQGNGTAACPIEIGSYETGARPHIAPGLGVQPYAIYLKNNGGFNIHDLELSDAYGGIVVYSDGTYKHKYLRIDHVDFHDITTQNAKTDLGPQLHEGAGISLAGAGDGTKAIFSDITVTRSTFLHCDTGIDTTPNPKNAKAGMWRNVNITDSTFIESYMTGGICLYFVDGGMTRNVRIERTGYKLGKSWGTAAFQILGSRNYVIADSAFKETLRPNGSPDGEGLDFESNNRNIVVRNNTISDNTGPAMLINGNNPSWRGHNADLLIEGNHMYRNNATHEYGNQAFHVWSHYLDKGIYFENAGVMRNNVIRLENDEQKFSASPLIFESNNTVYNASGRKIFGGFKKVNQSPGPRTSFEGEWKPGTRCGASHHSSNKGQSTFVAEFAGTQAQFIATTGPQMGIVAVSVDGSTESLLDLYSGNLVCSRAVYVTPILQSGKHAIRVRVTGWRNDWSSDTQVDLGGVEISTRVTER